MYNAKELVNLIITEIQADFDPDFEYTIENLLGKRVGNLDEMFTRCDAIYVVYNGATALEKTNVTEEFDLKIQFIVFEQMLGTQSKEAYLFDQLWDFLTWREFASVAAKYSGDQVDPYLPADCDLFAYDEAKGRAIWVISGTMKFTKNVTT
jgi:phosphoserine phosphatase